MQDFYLSTFGCSIGCFSVLSFALAVILSKNPIYSLFYLICVFVQICMLLLAIGVEFVSFLLLMVYVGAICILFLFVVMMMDINLVTLKQRSFNKKAFVVFILLFNLWLWFSPAKELFYSEEFLGTYLVWPDLVSSKGSLGVIASHLYSSYYLPFIFSGFILLVAMIGAIVITLKQKPYVKRQDVLYQNHRNFEKTIRKVSSR